MVKSPHLRGLLALQPVMVRGQGAALAGIEHNVEPCHMSTLYQSGIAMSSVMVVIQAKVLLCASFGGEFNVCISCSDFSGDRGAVLLRQLCLRDDCYRFSV